MVRRIKTHNLLNGILFSAVEFVITALIIAPFAVYYFSHEKIFYATISLGIILNCLTIVAFGVKQSKDHEKDLGIQHMFSKGQRERISREYPQLGSDTLVLILALLLPFVLFLWALGELLFTGSRLSKE